MFLFCLVFAMFCARLFICALWSPAGKGLTSWLSFVVSSVSLSLSHWYPGSGVVLDGIDSWSLHHYLLLQHSKDRHEFPAQPIFDHHLNLAQMAVNQLSWIGTIFMENCLFRYFYDVNVNTESIGQKLIAKNIGAACNFQMKLMYKT